MGMRLALDSVIEIIAFLSWNGMLRRKRHGFDVRNEEHV